MATLKIQPMNALVTDFVNQYNVWKKANNFFKSDDSESKFELSNNGLPCFQQQQVAEINASTSDTIVISCLTEGIHSYDSFMRYDKSKHYYIFTSGDWDIDYYELTGLSYTKLYYPWFLFNMSREYSGLGTLLSFTNKNIDFTSPKSNIFMSTIGSIRKERNVLLEELKSVLTYDNFIFRYSAVDYGIESSHLDILSISPNQFDPYMDILPEFYFNVSSSIPIQMYNSAYFNLLVETDIDYPNSFFITEKTVKTLLTRLPFVVYSTPLFLKNLRKLGFKTYNTLWDESYDEELDYVQRVKKIAKLCNELGNFDWQKHLHELEAIGNHNRLQFLEHNKLWDIFFKELENNIVL